MNSAIINITAAAVDQVKQLMSKAPTGSLGIKIGVKSGGCTGLSYTFDYATDSNTGDEIIKKDDAIVIIDAKAVMYIIGSNLDYVTNNMQSGFVFTNPNATSGCGCGKSFAV
mgnify:CR=1 FL=1